MDTNTAIWRTRTWIETAFADLENRESQSHETAYRVLLVSWMCDQLGGSHFESALFPTIVRRVSHLLDNAGYSSASATVVSPSLKLIVAILLKSEGIIIEDLDRFLQLSTQVVNSLDLEKEADRLEYLEKQVILHGAGLSPAPQLIDSSLTMDFFDRLTFPVDQRSMEELILWIESCTGWGTYPVLLPTSDRWVLELLSGLTVHYFRNYDLPMGCRLLRAICHLGSSDMGLEHLQFLLFQQHNSGPFGFFGPEEAELERLAPGIAADQELYLPITLQCLWTLGEASSNWRMLASLPNVSV